MFKFSPLLLTLTLLLNPNVKSMDSTSTFMDDTPTFEESPYHKLTRYVMNGGRVAIQNACNDILEGLGNFVCMPGFLLEKCTGETFLVDKSSRQVTLNETHPFKKHVLQALQDFKDDNLRKFCEDLCLAKSIPSDKLAFFLLPRLFDIEALTASLDADYQEIFYQSFKGNEETIQASINDMNREKEEQWMKEWQPKLEALQAKVKMTIAEKLTPLSKKTTSDFEKLYNDAIASINLTPKDFKDAVEVLQTHSDHPLSQKEAEELLKKSSFNFSQEKAVAICRVFFSSNNEQ